MVCQPEKWDARSVVWISTRSKIEYKFLNCLVCFSTLSCHSSCFTLVEAALSSSLSLAATGILYFHCVVLIVKTKKKESIWHFKCSTWSSEEEQRAGDGSSGSGRRRGGGGGVVLISELPWRAAIAVRCYEEYFAKVRQIPPHSVLIGLSDLQNREGMQGAWSSELSSRLPHWGYLMAHATKAPQWDTQANTENSWQASL